MDEPYDPTRPTLERLQRELDESVEDVAAGRLVPIGPVLDAINERSARRLEARRLLALDEGALTKSR